LLSAGLRELRPVAAAVLLALAPAGCSAPSMPVETVVDVATLVAEGACSRPAEDSAALFAAGEELRSVLLAWPGAPLVCEDVPIHEGAELRFEAGTAENLHAGLAEARFEVRVEAGGRPPLRWAHAVQPEAPGAWVEGRMDLASLAGRRARLVFEVSVSGSAQRGALGWALPQIHSSGRPLRRPKNPGRNVIVVSLDTVRPDHTGTYGYARGTTPHLDRLSREAEVWSHAYCPQTWTLTSHMSVFTGLYPQAHGVDTSVALRPGVPTLPLELQADGYRTAGFVHACHFMAGWYGFDRGFELYRETHEDAFARNRAVAAWAEKHAGERLFLFVHHYDAHSSFRGLPYRASGPLERLYPPASELSEAELASCFTNGFLRSAYLDGRPLDKQQLEHLVSLYDSGVSSTDAALGDLLARLDEIGVLSDSLLVVLSDHGEEFREHGGLLHEQPYDEVRRVLCVLRFPPGERRARVRSAPTMNVDLMPTILEWAGLPVPAGVQGLSLLGADPPASRPMHTLGISPLEAVWSGRDALVVRYPDGYGITGRPAGAELYDLLLDPAERQDLAGSDPRKAEALRELLYWRQHEDGRRARQDGAATGAERELSAEERERLEALGYVSP
jgi:arylsulfatase A-like enzyme